MATAETRSPRRWTTPAVAYRAAPAAGLISVIGVGLLVYRATRATGFYWQDDYGHLLLSRLAWHQPSALLGVWGRPLMTLAYMPAVLGPVLLARLTSVAMTAASAAMCWLIGRRAGRPGAATASVFLLAQPLTATLSYSALPETVFSFVLALALLLRVYRRPAAAAVVASLLPLARLEGLVVVVIWAAALALERRPRLIPLLAVGFLGWAAVAAGVSGDPLWLIHNNPNGGLGSIYGAAGWRYLFTALPMALGPVVIALAVAAGVGGRVDDRLVPAMMFGLFGFYLLAWGLPAFNTGTTPVYLVSVSVPAALCASETLDALIARCHPRHVLLAVPVFAALLSGSAPLMAAVFVVVATFVAITKLPLRFVSVGALATLIGALGLGLSQADPLTLTGVPLLARQLATQLGPDARFVSATTTPTFNWYANEPTPNATLAYVRHLPADAEIVWDSNVGTYDFSIPEAERLGFHVREKLTNQGQSLIFLVRR